MIQILHLALTAATLVLLLIVLIDLRDGKLDRAPPRKRLRPRRGRAYDLLRLTNL